MVIFEYDKEKHMQQIREEGREEGRRVGLKEGREEARLSKLAAQIRNLQERGFSVEDIAYILVESPEQIRQLMDTLAQPSA